MLRQSLSKERRRRRREDNHFLTTTQPLLLLLILVLSVLSLLFCHLHNEALKKNNSSIVEEFLRESMQSFIFNMKESDEFDAINENHTVAGLNCDDHGGPTSNNYSNEFVQEMVYWEDIPSDSRFVSMYHQKKEGDTQYITFEFDGAGWNNVRMAFETLVVLAIITGRTLVLPPEQTIWNLEQRRGSHGKRQRNKFSVSHFFPLQAVANEHVGLKVITTQEFLEREALAGKLFDTNGAVSFPPKNCTNWDGVEDLTKLNSWLRSVTFYPTGWDPNKCLLVFPASTHPKDLQHLLDIKASIQKPNGGGFPPYKSYIGKPSPANASTMDRMKENWADYWRGGKRLCTYDEKRQKVPVLHFPYKYEFNARTNEYEMHARLLTHFYSFLFFQDWRLDLWMKRFVRDHLRYVDSLQCAAARIVQKLRERARQRGGGNPQGHYDSFHIRRQDFTNQFEETAYDAHRIYNISKDELVENATIYIATDESNRSFFDPLRAHYDIVFLDDFVDELGGMNTNYYGMVEQLVVSRGRSFFGCWKSTFTNFVNRLRGYHANRAKAPGYQDGIIASWYYATEEHRNDMRTFYPVYQDYYYREFPTSWRLIDTGIDEMEKIMASPQRR